MGSNPPPPPSPLLAPPSVPYPHVTPQKSHKTNAEGLRAEYIHKESLNHVLPKNATWSLDAAKLAACEFLSERSKPPGTWKEITETPSVLTALAAVAAIPKNAAEKISYQKCVNLLNALSLAVHNALNLPFAIVFKANPNKIVAGPFLGDQLKPDSNGGRMTGLDLEAEVTDREGPAQATDSPPWSLTSSLGEHKTQEEVKGLAQLASYLVSLKRYRLDIATVYGYTIARGTIQLAGLNACEMFVSPRIPWNDVDPWLAYVCLVYRSEMNRDERFTYAASEIRFHRWDVEYPSERFAVAPFHVSSPPGRVTFSSFVLGSLASADADELSMYESFINREAEGFLKVSWQDIKSSWHEGDLLEYVHRTGWIPGVARHEWCQRDADADAVSGLDRTRVKETLRLRSVGEPLSQCGTPRELLYVMYDALEAHYHLTERDVLHRDLSWHNILCKPKHHASQQFASRPVVSRPCIKSILKSIQGTGESSCQSSVLLIDLDHGAKIPELRQDRDGRTQRTGTPMFIAVEMAVPRFRGLYFQHGGITFTRLTDALEQTEARKIKDAAFPDGDHDFMQKFLEVCGREARRTTPAERKSGEPIVHDLGHDVESLYWVFLWAVARALPRGKDEDIPPGALDDFCEAMLFHRVNPDRNQDRRVQYRSPHMLLPLFHPDLTRLASLFEDFAAYMNMPWHLYEPAPVGDGTVHQSHMHIAFRRLILAFVLDSANATVLDVPLDTMKPRYTTALAHMARQTSVSVTQRGPTGLSATAGAGSGSGSQKRKADDNGGEPAAPTAKKPRPSLRAMDPEDDLANQVAAGDIGGRDYEEPPAPPMQLWPSGEDTGTSVNPLSVDDVPPAAPDRSGRHQTAQVNVNVPHDAWYATNKDSSAADLICKIWRDSLWFGSGK